MIKYSSTLKPLGIFVALFSAFSVMAIHWNIPNEFHRNGRLGLIIGIFVSFPLILVSIVNSYYAFQFIAKGFMSHGELYLKLAMGWAIMPLLFAIFISSSVVPYWLHYVSSKRIIRYEYEIIEKNTGKCFKLQLPRVEIRKLCNIDSDLWEKAKLWEGVVVYKAVSSYGYEFYMIKPTGKPFSNAMATSALQGTR